MDRQHYRIGRTSERGDRCILLTMGGARSPSTLQSADVRSGRKRRHCMRWMSATSVRARATSLSCASIKAVAEPLALLAASRTHSQPQQSPPPWLRSLQNRGHLNEPGMQRGVVRLAMQAGPVPEHCLKTGSAHNASKHTTQTQWNAHPETLPEIRATILPCRGPHTHTHTARTSQGLAGPANWPPSVAETVSTKTARLRRRALAIKSARCESRRARVGEATV